MHSIVIVSVGVISSNFVFFLVCVRFRGSRILIRDRLTMSLILASLWRPQGMLFARSQHMGVICGTCCKSIVSSTIEERLHEQLKKKMKSNKVQLLESFEVYKRSLPVRADMDSQVQLPLYTLPYWACENDITLLAEQLERRGTQRSFVKYIAAPPSSGKTSAILPAFLKSAEGDGGFMHYFYLAFDNNNDTSTDCHTTRKCLKS